MGSLRGVDCSGSRRSRQSGYRKASQPGARIGPKSGMIAPNMGKKVTGIALQATPSSIADVLFTPVQQRLLALLYGQPQRKYQSNEIIRLVNAGTGAVHRALTRMAAAGLVSVESVGNQKHYQANTASPVFEELSGLVRKTVGLRIPLQAALEPLAERIVAAFVYGSVARGTERQGSDIDLLVIADDINYAQLYEALPQAEAALGRPINPTVMTIEEWQRKLASADSFAARIAAQPRLFILGDENALG